MLFAMPLSFLDLPRELRDDVYKELFLIEDPVRLFIREISCPSVDCYETTDDEDDEDYEDDEDDGDDEDDEDDEDGEADKSPYEIAWSSDSSDDGDPKAPSLPRRPDEDVHQPEKEPSTESGPKARLDERYSLVLVTDSSVMRSFTGSTKENYGQKNALLQANRQVSKEAREYLYSHTHFVVSPDYRLCWHFFPVYPFFAGEALRKADGVCVLNTFFDTIGPSNAQSIRHFWFSPPGLLEWELLSMCITLHDRCPNLQSLKLAKGRFLDHEDSMGHYDLASYMKPIGKYFEEWLGKDPERLAEFYDALAKMFGLDRIILD